MKSPLACTMSSRTILVSPKFRCGIDQCLTSERSAFAALHFRCCLSARNSTKLSHNDDVADGLLRCHRESAHSSARGRTGPVARPTIGAQLITRSTSFVPPRGAFTTPNEADVLEVHGPCGEAAKAHAATASSATATAMEPMQLQDRLVRRRSDPTWFEPTCQTMSTHDKNEYVSLKEFERSKTLTNCLQLQGHYGHLSKKKES